MPHFRLDPLCTLTIILLELRIHREDLTHVQVKGALVHVVELLTTGIPLILCPDHAYDMIHDQWEGPVTSAFTEQRAQKIPHTLITFLKHDGQTHTHIHIWRDLMQDWLAFAIDIIRLYRDWKHARPSICLL